MQETVLDKLKFVNRFGTARPRKTQADMLLLYYLGILAIRQTNKTLLEIGVGMSSYAMHEITMMFDQVFYAIDLEQDRLDAFCLDSTHIKKIYKSSLELDSLEVGVLGYAHIDGDKNYPTTLHDLKYVYDHLDDMGLVCVNAYGLNCWPTVMNAVNSVVSEGLFEVLVIGDAAVWLVKKSSYIAWLQILKTDFEFELLSVFLNIHNSSGLKYSPEYFFMNSIYPTPVAQAVDVEQFQNYYQQLAKYSELFNHSHTTGKTSR